MTAQDRRQRARRRTVLLLVAALAVALVPGLVSGEQARAAPDPAVGAGGRGRPAGPVAETMAAGAPRSDGHVEGVVIPPTDADVDTAPGSGATVLVEVLAEGDTAAVAAAVATAGGEVRGELPGVLVLATLPSGAVDAVADHPSVRSVRPPLRSAPLTESVGPADRGAPAALARMVGRVGRGGSAAATSAPVPSGLVAGATGASEEVGKTAVGLWTAAGHRGQGQRVGIIDTFDGALWGDAAAYGAVPTPAATFCRRSGVPCSVWSGQSYHGVAVAEIVHDQAPDAALYLASVETSSDYAAAVAWLDGRGVTVVNHSQTAPYDGPGDGTGPASLVVDDAVARGMLWVQAAGNAGGVPSSAGDYWRGPFVDSDGNGFHEFGGGDEILSLDCSFLNGVRWSDFGEAGITDYDVVLVSMPDQTVLSSSSRSHGDGLAIEWPDMACSPGQWVGLAIHRFAAGAPEAQPDTIEVMGNGVYLERWNNPYSASGPFGDSASTGMLSVGAVDPAKGTLVGPYSSWGPTNDGRRKPDLTAASCVTSLTMSLIGISCFNGTSAAAPAVAGAAAAVRSSGVATQPADLAAFLEGNVVDRGVPGPDDVYGLGELVLGPPPVDGLVNDDLLDAWPVRPGTYLASTGVATPEPAEPDHGGVGGASVWFRFTAPWDGTLTLLTAGSSFDTLIGMYAGDAYPLAALASDDDGGIGSSSRVDVAVAAGTTYRIALDGAAGANGLAHLSVALGGSCPSDFADVAAAHPFCPAIAWASAAGVTEGYTDGTFRPAASVSRQAMVAFLRRMAGSPPVPVGAPTFSDVATTSPFYDDVRWAAATGVTTGYIDGTFRPANPVSRQAMAAFLHRLSGQPSLPAVAPAFRDVDASHPFALPIRWLAGSGVASGYADGTYKPAAPVSRQALASFLWLWSGR